MSEHSQLPNVLSLNEYSDKQPLNVELSKPTFNYSDKVNFVATLKRKLPNETDCENITESITSPEIKYTGGKRTVCNCEESTTNMAKRLKNCRDHQISVILDVSSDTDDEQGKFNEKTETPKKSKRLRCRSSESVQNSTETIDSETMLIIKRPSMGKKNACMEKMDSLKIKLKHSVEQGIYKIDTSSDNDIFCRKEMVMKEKFDESATKENEFSQNSVSFDQNTPRKTNRIRKIPLRYMDYQCLDSPKYRSPTLRNKKSVNYNEDHLFPQLEVLDLEGRKQKEEVPCTDKVPDNDCVSNMYNLRTVHLKNKSNKVVTPKKNNCNDSRNTDSEGSNEMLTRAKNNRTPQRTTRAAAAASTKSMHSDSDSESSSKNIVEHSSPPNKENKPLILQKECQLEELGITNLCLDQITITKTVKIMPKTPQRKSYLQKDVTEIVKDSSVNVSKSFASPKLSAVTPSMKMRSTFLAKPSTPLQQARSKLHVSVVPKSLPCREEEFNDIFTFLQGKLTDGSGGCIYISGVPGTGKTATVNEVIRCLRRLEAKQELPHFNFVEINGMKIPDPRQAYVQIYKQLFDKLVTWELAYKLLDTQYKATESKRKMTLILIDELDLLCTKRQDVIYNLLDWSTRESARLVITTIANTMDLPERVLMGRVTSRLGLTRVTFQPYTHEQLQEIILTRLKNVDAFKGETIQLVSRKVAAVSGDARRALDICRRAAEIAENKDNVAVSMKDVNDALTEMVAAPKVQAIRHCSTMERIFLQSVCCELARTGVEEAVFKNIYSQFESICSFNGTSVPTVTETLGICARLGASRLLICELSRADISQRILLNVSPDDVHYALQEIKTD